MANHFDQLHELAQLYRVERAYWDVFGRQHEASPEALLAVLSSLGARAYRLEDTAAALRERKLEMWRRMVEPVVVAWDGSPGPLRLHFPAHRADSTLSCRLELEGGEVQTWESRLSQLPELETAELEGVRYLAKQLELPDKLPPGYHRLRLEFAGQAAEALVISAPLQAYTFPMPGTKTWGVFLPLYALHSRRSWGAGDLGDLRALRQWVDGLGGHVVATLPLLASFLDEPFVPSPYEPVSRRVWNEFYIDLEQVPELARCHPAQALLGSARFRKEIRALRAAHFVDYRRQMWLKRRVLEHLARCFFAEPAQRQAPLHRFLEAHPHLDDYARFRAVCERQRAPWPTWPAALREARPDPASYDEKAKRYHLYTQWIVHEQMEGLAQAGGVGGPVLYLDLPLGVHPAGYDTWRERAVFAQGVTGGAPPDSVFLGGQNWRFPPLHPERIRDTGYAYFIACVRHHLRYARLLRIDHVMGLHRLFWIPAGMETQQGVYVGYRAEEFYAILSLESHRHQAAIVGENLGTVPPYVDASMERHNIQKLYVLEYQLAPDPRQAIAPTAPDHLAALNTHDMPTFAGFWRGLDLDQLLKLGVWDQAGVSQERHTRRVQQQALVSFLAGQGWLKPSARTVSSVLQAAWAHLAASPARVVVVNLEDLWLERNPQNVPGTGDSLPNWRRKARYGFEKFRAMPRVVKILRQVHRLRGNTSDG